MWGCAVVARGRPSPLTHFLTSGRRPSIPAPVGHCGSTESSAAACCCCPHINQVRSACAHISHAGRLCPLACHGLKEGICGCLGLCHGHACHSPQPSVAGPNFLVGMTPAPDSSLILTQNASNNHPNFQMVRGKRGERKRMSDGGPI
jgi:hypothetical protein